MKTTSTLNTKPGLQAVFASPYTPIAVINGTPVYPIGGGRGGGGISFAVGDDDGDDPEFDDDDDDDDGDDDEPEVAPSGRRNATTRRSRQSVDEPDDEPDDDWQPPTRDVVQRMESALKRANSEAGKRRRVGKTMEKLGIDDFGTWLTERGIDPETGSPFGDDVVDPTATDDVVVDDAARVDEYGYEVEAERPRRPRATDREITRSIRAAEKRAEEKARQTYVPILAQQSATSALREAGFRGDREQLNLALRMIDPEQIDVVFEGGEFDIEGLDEQVAEIQDRFPELFRGKDTELPARRERTAGTRPTRRTGARDVDGGERGRQPAKPKGWKEQVAEQMLNRGRR